MTVSERTVIHLQASRLFRSIAQGIAIVDLALYLKDIQWTANAIGSVLSASGVVGALLILLVGILSDKHGRKSFLVTYEIITVIASLLLVYTSNNALLAIVIIITGLGRGQNGAAGPFTPAEQAWLAMCVPQSRRGHVFSINSALGFAGMAIGSAVAGTTHFWSVSFPGLPPFQSLFLIMVLVSVASLISIASSPSEKKIALQRPKDVHHNAIPVQEKLEDKRITKKENRNIMKLSAVNMINGLAVGFIGPMISYWFALKFGVSPSEIGLTMALSFVVMAFSSIIIGFLTLRFGMVKTVVWIRMIGIILLLILPLIPTFWPAAIVYIIRSAFSRGTQGARSALSSSLTRDKRRGFSVSINSFTVRLSSSIGPSLSGYLLDLNLFAAPFFIAGGLQLVSNLLYGRFFKDYDMPTDENNN